MSDMKITIKTSIDDSQAREQINKLISEVKKEPIKLTADASSLEKSLSDVLSTLKEVQSASKNLNFSGSTKGTSSMISEFKALTNQYNALQQQLSKETNAKSMEVLKKQIKEVGTSLDGVKQKITQFGTETEKAMMNSFSTTSTQKLEASLSKTFSSLSSKAKSLGTEIQSAFNNPNMNMGQLNSIQTRFEGLQNLIKNFDMSKLSGESLNNLATKLNELQEKMKQLKTAADQTKLENKFNIDCTKAISQLEQLKQKYQALGKDTSGIDKMITEVERLQSAVGSTNLGTLQKGLNDINNQASKMKSSLSGVAKSVKGTFSQIASSFSMFAPGYIIGTSLVSGIRSIKEEILDLDAAMTDLKKVSDDTWLNTSDKLQGTISDAAQIAKDVAGSVPDVITSMADAVKSGAAQSLEASKEIAKSAQIFANVGDMDIGTATSGIATIINAWKLDPLKETSVVVGDTTKKTNELTAAMDDLNYVANNFSIDVPNLIDAFQNGGATMATIGQATIQETAAMATAMNSTVQNGSEVGNALKSLTSNFQGLSTSAKDGSIVLTKAGVALREVAGIDMYSDKQKGQLKSMVQIYEELAEKWNTYTDEQQAAISSSLAGKTRSSAFSALMENYDIYKQIMDDFADGAQFDSAAKEKQHSPYVQKCA